MPAAEACQSLRWFTRQRTSRKLDPLALTHAAAQARESFYIS